MKEPSKKKLRKERIRAKHADRWLADYVERLHRQRTEQWQALVDYMRLQSY